MSTEGWIRALCDCGCYSAKRWGYQCRHCEAWLDIGREPTEREKKENCQPCEKCAAKKQPLRQTRLAGRESDEHYRSNGTESLRAHQR